MDKKKNIKPQAPTNVSYGKYSQAVLLYATTDMTGKQIAEQCGVSLPGFRIYLRRHCHSLILKRHGLETTDHISQETVKLRGKRGQTPAAYKKYRQAIEACDNISYIEYNISQIARKFGLNGTALGNQLKLHYPEILERREKARMRFGINDNFQRGPHPDSVEEYAGALELLRTTNKNLPSIAKECNVSLAGLSQYLRFYHKELVENKTKQREQAIGNRKRGRMSGNNRTTKPTTTTCEKYRRSLELYRTTHLTTKEIVACTGVTIEGFRNHLRKWHRDLMLERRGGTPGKNCNECKLELSHSKRYLKSTAAKYAPVIESLKASPRPVAHAATEFGVDADTFRRYLRMHEPTLAASLKKTKQ